MLISSYKYLTADSFVSGRRIISDIDRSKYTSQVFNKEFTEYIADIKTVGRTALLIAGGPAVHHSDARNIEELVPKGVVAVKSQIGYNMYNIARMFTCDIDFVSINTNTCASSMYSLYEAKDLFTKGYTDVIIVAVDIVDNVQELLFKQLNIDLVCGDCVSIVHLSSTDGIASIDDVEWLWNRDSSPMSVSSTGYSKVINRLDTTNVDIIKVHGSGTERNTVEELTAINDCGLSCDIVEYKSKIGHTQGASSIVEICMLIDNEVFNKALVLASGLGGFYGGCIITMKG